MKADYEEPIEKFIEIDYQEIGKVLWRKKMSIILVAVICAILGYAYSAFVQVPIYKASTTLYIFDENNRDQGSLEYNDLYLSRTLTDSYIIIMQSDRVLGQVAKAMGGDYTAEVLRNEVSAESVNKTEVFKVTVSDLDPINSAKIANLIAQVLKAEIAQIVHAGTVEVIDEAIVPEKASYSIGVYKATFLGGFLGFILIALFFAVLEILDTRIKNEAKLTRNFALPLIGVIPTLISSQKLYAESYEQKTKPQSAEGA